ncbi:MAG: hypothetical protein ACM3NV_03660, partial [Syntrophothermus sp.]
TSTERGSFECSLDGAAFSPCASPQTYTSLADGPHSFEVRAKDTVGNKDPTPAKASFSVDTTAPQTTITQAPAALSGAAEASFAFESSEAGSFECSLDGAAFSPCASPQTYTSLADGPHSFEVRAKDTVGNKDPTPAKASFEIDTGPPKPVAGQTVNLEPVDGNVQLICPGESEFSKLTGFKQVPLGCLINTRNGTVNLTASKGASGELQAGNFWGGVFIVSQKTGDNQALVLKLAGKRMCERRAPRARRPEVFARGGKRSGRRLWGSGKGNFKTTGSYGSATVRGTTWLVVDRCDASTLFKVGEGTVWVRDFVKDKSLVLTTGEEYLAKADIPRLAMGRPR